MTKYIVEWESIWDDCGDKEVFDSKDEALEYVRCLKDEFGENLEYRFGEAVRLSCWGFKKSEDIQK
jgi:hypothetical protein